MPAIRRKFTPLERETSGDPASTAMRPRVPLDAPLDALIRRTGAQARAFQSGRMRAWFRLLRLADDFTLMQPFGGRASHGFDGSPERLAQMAVDFRHGDATIELEKTYVCGDLAVLVFVERQHGEVQGLPSQDWSLRVTQVYRRQGAEWRLAHRHADPLVRRRSVEQTARLARGADMAE